MPLVADSAIYAALRCAVLRCHWRRVWRCQRRRRTAPKFKFNVKRIFLCICIRVCVSVCVYLILCSVCGCRCVTLVYRTFVRFAWLYLPYSKNEQRFCLSYNSQFYLLPSAPQSSCKNNAWTECRTILENPPYKLIWLAAKNRSSKLWKTFNCITFVFMNRLIKNL